MELSASLLAFRQPRAIVVVHTQSKCGCAQRDRLPDAPHAEDAEAKSTQRSAKKQRRRPSSPLTASQCGFRRCRSTGRSEDQEQRKIRDGIREDVGRIEDGQPPRRRCGQIDVIVPNGVGSKDLDAGRQAADAFCIQLVVGHDQNRLEAAGHLQQSVSDGIGFTPELRVELRIRTLDDRIRRKARHQQPSAPIRAVFSFRSHSWSS